MIQEVAIGLHTLVLKTHHRCSLFVFWGGVLDDRFQCHCFCAETWHSLVLSLYPKFTNLPFTFAVKLDFYFDNTRKDELNLSQERQRNKGNGKFYLTFSLQLIRSVEGFF